jgi:hypothetical protein
MKIGNLGERFWHFALLLSTLVEHLNCRFKSKESSAPRATNLRVGGVPVLATQKSITVPAVFFSFCFRMSLSPGTKLNHPQQKC